MLAMMLMFGQNGMFCPLNKTSRTTPNASRLTPTSVKPAAQAFILFKISILVISYLKTDPPLQISVLFR